MAESRPPFPPFTLETAQVKVKAAQDAWNSKEPHKVKLAYTPDSIWRNRGIFLQGRDEIAEFLTAKWDRERHYRLRKELFAFTENKVCSPATDLIGPSCYPRPNNHLKIAVQFWYEFCDESGQWWRCYGLEDWTFADNGLMRKRQMSGNDVQITEEERWFKDGVDVNTVRYWREALVANMPNN